MSIENNYIVSDHIAEWLENHEISVVFGIIGSANSYIFDSIIRRGYTKIIYMHHEQAVAMAAGAYYRTSGKISVAIVTAGGGASNAITGVLSNWADSIPCIVMSGQESTKYIEQHEHLRMYGTQGFDVVNMVQKITKFAQIVDKPSEIILSLDKAYKIALSGRQGPVWLDLPMDVQSTKINKSELLPSETEYSEDSDIDLNYLIELMNVSEKPVILAGHGIRLSKSINEFNCLVSKFQIPILHSWSAIDVISSDNPLNFGCPGIYGQRVANFIIQNCDLLIVIGSRLALPQTSYNIDNFAPNAKIVMINNDENELNKHSRYEIKINSDCKKFIESLMLYSPDSYKPEWVDKCNFYKQEFPLIEDCHLKDNENFDNSYVFINQISQILDDDHIIVIGQGTPLPCAHQALFHKSNQTIFASNGLGEMGNGLPSAIGAAIASPEKKIILFDGDGSSMMNLQEMQTLIGYNIPLKIVIFNNDGYLFIKHTQKMLFEGRYTGVDAETGVSLPKFSKIANAFGIEYFSSVDNNVQEFLNFERCAIYEIFMNPEQDLVPKVKGIMTESGFLSPPIEDMSPLLPLETIQKCMTKVNKISYEIRS
jgi:acetolactate synthase-1/2/3 large subunit